ncbi:MAG: T9SS type A sorting domain-containing protein [Bacteroidia bacterium]
MKKIFILTALLAISCIASQAQWTGKSTGCSPNPQKGIFQLRAVNSNVAWGLTYLRNDGFTSPTMEFTRTIDGGNHWNGGTIPFTDQIMLGLSPLSASTAYIISTVTDYSSSKLLKTTNGGVTWNELSVSPVTRFWDNIYFFNSNDGVIYGDTALVTGPSFMIVYTTHNGGITWSLVPDANMATREYGESFYPSSSTHIGNTLWTVSTNGRVWKSIDKGEHWTVSSTPVTEAVVSNIEMRDAMHGLWGIEDELYRTSDGGITWTEVEPTGKFFTFGLSYVPGTVATWVSTGGDTSSIDYFTGALHGLGSSYSIDDGNTWTTIDTGVDHLGIAMVSPFKGYCGGFNNGTSDGIYKYNGPALGYSCGNGHTYMCHHGHTICVANNKILHHLFHGDYLGACFPNYKTGETVSDVLIMDDESGSVNIFPNPISTSSTISFALNQSQNISAKIYDATGKVITTLCENKSFQEGEFQFEWNAENVDAGIYFLKIEGENFSETKKLSVVK